MRRKEREITDPEEIEGIIRKGKVMHLAMCDGGRPYVVPLTYGYEDGKVYFHCATEGRKLDVLKGNDQVCFAIDLDHQLVGAAEACKSDIKFRSVVGEGRASILTGSEEKKRGLDVIMRQVFGGAPPSYAEGALHKIVVVRIDVQSLTGKKSGY